MIKVQQCRLASVALMARDLLHGKHDGAAFHLRSPGSLGREIRLILVSVKDDSHLFQSIALGLRIVEESCGAEDYQDDDEDNVVFPADTGQSNRVDKGVEEDGAYIGDPSDSETTGAEPEGPDLARISGQKGSTVVCQPSEIVCPR